MKIMYRALREFNEKLALNGHKEIDGSEYDDLRRIRDSYMMEDERIREMNRKVIVRLIQGITVLGVTTLYYYISELLSSVIGG